MKISTDNLQNRPLVDFRWGFWVEFCLIFCKMVVKIGRREYTQRWVDIALGMRELVRTGMWWWELGGWERGRWSGGSSDQHRCRNVRCPAATARIGCGELARWALLADRLLLRRCGRQGFCPESVCRRGVGCGTRGV